MALLTSPWRFSNCSQGLPVQTCLSLKRRVHEIGEVKTSSASSFGMGSATS